MKPTFGSMFLALTVACVAEGLIFQPTGQASAESAADVAALAESADNDQIRIGLKSIRPARGPR